MKAKINNQFDYITLRVKCGDKKTLNITRSRNGVTVSGTEATRERLAYFDRWFKEQKGTIGQSFEDLRFVAEMSETVEEFIERS